MNFITSVDRIMLIMCGAQLFDVSVLYVHCLLTYVA